MGINVTKYRMMAFVTSAVLAGHGRRAVRAELLERAGVEV